MLLLILLLISNTNSFKLYNNNNNNENNIEINEIDEIKDQDTIYELINYYHNIDFSVDNSIKCINISDINSSNQTLYFNNKGYLCIIDETNTTYYLKIGILYFKCMNTIDIYNCSHNTVLQECTDTIYKINMFILKNKNVEFYSYQNTSIISLNNYYYKLTFPNPFDEYYLINNKDIIAKKSISYHPDNNIKDCNLFIKYKTPLYTNKINAIKFNENIYIDYNKFNNISFKSIFPEQKHIYKNNTNYYYSFLIILLLILIITIIIKKCRERKKYVINKRKACNKEIFNKNGEMIIIQNKKYKIKHDGVYKQNELIVKGLPKILFFKNYLKYSEDNNGSILDIMKNVIILKQINNNLNILNLDYYLQKNLLYNNNNLKEPIAQINEDNNTEIEVLDKTKYNIENGNLYNKEKLLISKLYKY